MTAPETYRRHAQPLSEAEQALWNRPAAEESLSERVAAALCNADADQGGFTWDEATPGCRDAYRTLAEAAVDVITGRSS